MDEFIGGEVCQMNLGGELRDCLKVMGSEILIFG